MKNLYAYLIVFLVFVQCHDQRENVQTQQNPLLNRTVGEQIPIDVAERWIARYETKSSNAREEHFSISAASLNALLSDTENQLGVILHHATDAASQHHILIIPVNETLLLWTNGEVLDASTNTFIDGTIANIWAEAFKQQHPAAAWSHFFGYDIFEEILAKEGFTEMEIVPAENDEGQPQLLLFVWSGGSGTNGRTEGEELTVYDMSAVCPPTCNDII